jgi:hypothetical protein
MIMKARLYFTLAAFFSASMCAKGQGTFVYDQQSSDESVLGEAVVGITSFQQPVGQSFTPTLSSVGFIRLQLLDPNPGNGLGTVLYMNLRTESITGPILASSQFVSLPDGTPGPPSFIDFFFGAPPVVPGITYYFQPVIQSGDGLLAGRFIPNFNYPGGTEYIQGQPGNNDLWFREGIVVPEPGTWALLVIGACCLAWRRRFFT